MLALLTLRNLKIAGIIAVVLAAVWWHQHAVAIAYRQGATDRERSALQEAAAKVESDTAAQRKQLADRQVSLDAEQSRNAGERTALNSARAGLSAALSASLNQIATQNLDIKNEIQDTPDDAVNARFRLSLQRARTAERERTAQP